jgi:hypothetical protein
MCAFFLSLLAAAGTVASGLPWEKSPEEWTMADVYRILRDSPWSPTKFSLESSYSQHPTDAQTGLPSDAASNGRNSSLVRGVMISRAHPMQAIPVLWWSAKIVRRAEGRCLALRQNAGAPAESGKLTEMPEYVLSIEGDEPMRILRDAKEDLHDTIFLELENGGTLDLASVKYEDDSDSDVVRTELHFGRMLNGQPAIEPESERVILHCRATAKKEMPGRDNNLSFRVEFSPRQMKAQGQSDL